MISTDLAHQGLSEHRSIPPLQVFNCLIELNEQEQITDRSEHIEKAALITSINREEDTLYPVSSMMQPSQASGHLQSPAKKNRRRG